MKTLITIFFALVAVHQSAKAQHNLEIEITELRSDKGAVMLELFDGDHKTVAQKISVIKNGKVVIVIENLKTGRYAARYFHDENSNGKLDTNFLGIPNEGYGFTNNAYGTFGPGPFKDWLVDVNKNTKVVLITKN